MARVAGIEGRQSAVTDGRQGSINTSPPSSLLVLVANIVYVS